MAFRLRRGDMRTLVACGSAGAISAAFGAPLTGAFYAFELILGTYTPFVLAPVGAAAVCGVSRFQGVWRKRRIYAANGAELGSF